MKRGQRFVVVVFSNQNQFTLFGNAAHIPAINPAGRQGDIRMNDKSHFFPPNVIRCFPERLTQATTVEKLKHTTLNRKFTPIPTVIGRSNPVAKRTFYHSRPHSES
jgi:hypothetical protein